MCEPVMCIVIVQVDMLSGAAAVEPVPLVSQTQPVRSFVWRN